MTMAQSAAAPSTAADDETSDDETSDDAPNRAATALPSTTMTSCQKLALIRKQIIQSMKSLGMTDEAGRLKRMLRDIRASLRYNSCPSA